MPTEKPTITISGEQKFFDKIDEQRRVYYGNMTRSAFIRMAVEHWFKSNEAGNVRTMNNE